MTEQKEAWERIAPELPPGWGVEFDAEFGHMPTAPGANVVTHVGPDRQAETRDEAAEWCWWFFGITRKRYAELIAPERVREVALGKLGEDLSGVEMSNETHTGAGAWFIVYERVGGKGWASEHCRGHGHTLCDAAWAAIQALGGGE